MDRYVVNELDVFPSIESGLWDINDVMRDCARVELKDPYNVREVLKKVRKAGYNIPKGKYTTNIQETQCSDLFEIINRKTQKPVLQLECIEG